MSKLPILKAGMVLCLAAGVMCGGATEITPTRVLNRDAYTDADNQWDHGVVLESDYKNTIVAAWRSTYNDGPLKVARTVNSGLSWSASQVVPGADHDPILLYVGGETWVLLNLLSNKVTRSTDGGETWSGETPMSTPYMLMPFSSMYASNCNGTLLALARGSFGSNEVKVLRSVDAAATWVEVGTPPEGATVFSPIQHAGGSNWICQSTASTFISADDGVNWSLAGPASFVDRRLTSFASNHAGNLMATLADSNETHVNTYVTHSSDGGITWSVPTLLGSIPITGLPSLTRTSPKVVYCGGQTWSVLLINAVYDTRFLMSSSAMFLTRTHDNGVSWTPVELLVPDVGDWYGDTSYADGFSNVYAGIHGNLVTAWDVSELTINGRDIGWDGDIAYRTISDAPLQAAAQDWQLFE